MDLNRNHIYAFISKYMKLTKRELAKKMFFDESNLSPRRSYNPDKIYERVFDVGDRDREAEILNSLKYFLEIEKKLKDSLADIWEEDYKKFVTELLLRANVPPPKSEPTIASASSFNEREAKQSRHEQIERINQNEVIAQAQKLFKRAEKDHRIAHRLRKMFLQDNRGYRIEDFIRNYLYSSNEGSGDDLLDDIHGLLQTIYENCIENEMYDETIELFKIMNDYIDKSICDAVSDSQDEIAALCSEIISLICEIFEYDYE